MPGIAASLGTFTLALAWVSVGAPARAQRSEAAVRGDIEFARSLASDWNMGNWAKLALDRIERSGVPPALHGDFDLARCDVLTEQAKAERAPERRNEFFQSALAAYQRMFEGTKAANIRSLVAAAYAEASASYARARTLDVEESEGAAARKIQDDVVATLSKTAEITGPIADSLAASSERSNEQEKALLRLLSGRGGLLLELGKLTGKQVYFDAGVNDYERLAEMAGDGTPQCLRAFVGLGDNYSAQGRYRDAADFYRAVVEYAVPLDKQTWAEAAQGMSPEEKARRFVFMQMSTPGLLASLAALGETSDACAWGLHFYTFWKREEQRLTSPIGDLAVLGLARLMLDSGGYVGGNLAAGEAEWFASTEEMAAKYANKKYQRSAQDFALALAHEINRTNQGNVLQVRAQRLISEILSRPGVVVDPGLLFEAAQADFGEGKWTRAVQSMKKVLALAATLPDHAERDELASKAAWHVARSLERLDRPLEAALAYQDGATTYRGEHEWAARNAEGFYRQIGLVRRTAKDDVLINGLWNQAERLIAELSSGAAQAEVTFRKADRLYQERKYAEAREEYAKVPPDAEIYELALVYKGVCDFQLNDLEAADQLFDDYLNRFVKDDRNRIDDPRKLARRDQASALATMYWGLIAYARANDGKGDWNVVIARLGDFHERFASQDTFVPLAMYRTLFAYLQLGDLTNVQRMYQGMLQRFPENRWTGTASVEVYKKLQQEYERARSADPNAAKQILRQMAEYLSIGNKNAANPSFNNLRLESKHWLDLEEWDKAEQVLESLRAKFGATETDNVERFVIPDLARALAKQLKVKQAAELLAPLVEAKKLGRDSARLYARCLAGWCEFPADQAKPVQTSGVGGEANLETAVRIFEQLTAAETKFDGPWYEGRFDAIYAYLQWGKIDDRKSAHAKAILATMTQDLGAGFEEIADAAIRKRFNWLQAELR